MPLIKSKSPEAFKSNLKAEINAGKPMKQSLAIAYAMKKKSKKMAHGGMMEDEARRKAQYSMDGNEAHIEVPMTHEESSHRMSDFEDKTMGNDDDADMITRIMHKRKMMAEGGPVVADEMGEQSDDHSADFDYLSIGDLDDSTTNSGAADGDELGNHVEDEDRRDIVSRIMKSRSKKDRMPKPA